MRRPVSGRDAEYALKVIDVLEPQVGHQRACACLRVGFSIFTAAMF
jgi:hypothetical protein